MCRQRGEKMKAQAAHTHTHTEAHTYLPPHPIPVGDSMAAEAYPEAIGDGEDEAGGMMGPPPPELLPGLGHFFDDFFSFIQGNSGASGPAGVAVAVAGA